MSRSRRLNGNFSAPQIETSPRVVAPPEPGRGTRAHGGARPIGDWRDHALCLGQGNKHGSVWLYPSKHERAVVMAAAARCHTCPVRAECAEQPRPHVGITAARIHWDTTPATEVRICEGCLEPMQKRARFCTERCRSRWYYEAQLMAGERPVGPLRDWFGDKPVSTIAQECGVSVRTVYRWDISGTIPAGSVRQLTTRLNVKVTDIWLDEAEVG